MAGNAGTGTIQIRVDLHNAVQNLQKLNTTLRQVDERATITNRKIAGLSTSLRTQTQHLRDIREATQRAVRVNNEMLTAMYGVLGMTRQLNQSLQQQTQLLAQVAQNGHRASQSYQSYRSQTSELMGSLISLAVAFGATTSAVDLFKNSLNVTKELDSINKTFYAITGSMNGANMEMSYVREMAQGLGLDFMSLAKSYKGFSAATKFANMDLSTSKEIFESVAGASTVLGLSGQKTELVLMALEQMVSKGVVSMEELRRQLGDQLPGAFELGAKAMNMGLAEFNKFVASGQLMTEDFLPRFARTLKETYATVENIGLAVKTPRAEIQKLQNELLFMQDTFARQGFLTTVIEGVRELTAALQTSEVKQNVIELGRAFGVLVSMGMSLVKFLAEHTTMLKNLLIVYLSWKIAVASVGKVLVTSASATRTFALATEGAAGAMAVAGARAATFTNWVAKFGGLIAGLAGPIAAVGALLISYFLPAMQESSNMWKESRDFADKFGVSAGEAEAQLAMFLSTATNTDPLAQLNKRLEELNTRLQDIRQHADVSMESLIEKMERAFEEIKPSNAIFDSWGGGISEVPELQIDFVDEKKVQQQADFAKTTLLNAMAEIREGGLTSGKAIATYLDGIKATLMQEASDTKNAWMPVFNYIQQAAVAALSTWEQKRQVLKELELKKVNEDWFQFVKLSDDVQASLKRVGEATKNMRIGMDMEADIKSFESVMKLVDKYYTKSEEGIRKQYENTIAQIDNAENVAKAWAETGKLKIELERSMMKVEIERTKAEIAAGEARLVAAQNESEGVVSAVKAQIEAYRVLLLAQNASVAGLDAQVAQIDQRVAEVVSKIPEARKAALAEMEKTLKKNGVGGGSSGGGKKKGSGAGAQRRDQNSLNTITGEADKARQALRQLQDKHEELVARLNGDSFGSQIAKIDRQAIHANDQLDNSFKKLMERFNQMANGPQKEAAKQEIETVKELVAEQRKQIDANAEIERQMVRIQQQLAAYDNAAERAKNAGDFTEYWAQTQKKLNDELDRMTPDSQGRAAKEQEERMARMRAEWDMLGLASQQMQQWSFNAAMSIQDDFANIIPNALDSTISAFSTMFTDILFGTKEAENAWQAFTQAITNMGKQIINTIIQIALKMMILKMFDTFSLFAADGAVVSNGGVQTAANGRVVGGGGVRHFASGGILTSPQLFQTKSGTPVVAGEAGPEAFVPLGRTREGKLGIETTGGGLQSSPPIMIVNVYNSASDKVQTSQQQSVDQNGNMQLDVFIEQIDAAIGKRIGQGRSSIGRAIDKTRGTSPSKALYS